MRVRFYTKHTISIAIVFLLLFTLIPSQVAHASTTETYYSGAGDGNVAYGGSSAQAWATVHHATSGEVVDYTTTGSLADSSESTEGSGWNSITRAFLPFNTAALPDTATITAATLNIYVTGTVDGDNDGYDYVSVVQTTQASATSLVLDDYDQCGAIQSPQKGAADIDITGIGTGAYLTFTLNATGISWINLTGWTQLGIREGHDVVDHQITANKADTVGFYSSEYTGTSKDPYLSITYTVPSGAWYDVSTWTASLATRTWSSGTSWLFDFGTRIWVDVTKAWTTNTSTFYITTAEDDGFVYGHSTNYTTAHDTSYGLMIYEQLSFGQDKVTVYYTVSRTFLKFDTSSIPSGAVIISASLGLYGVMDESTKDFVVNLQKWTGDTPITLVDYNQFDGTNYDDGNFNTTDFITTGYNNITISNFDLITKGGNTLVCVRSNRDINSLPPTVSEPEKVLSLSFENGLNYMPRLDVTWQVAGQGFTFDLVTRAWENIAWIFYLGTSIWKDIATWATNLSAMMWRDLTWLFHLLPRLPEWVNVAVWIFSLTSPQWMLAALWNLQLGGAGIAFLFIAILLLIVIVAGIIAIAYRRPKR